MTLEQIHPRSVKHLSEKLGGLVRGRLWAQVLLGMACGIGTGIALGPATGWVPPDTAVTIGDWLALPGQAFLAALQMIVVPLVFASIIRGLAASEDRTQLRQMGVRAIGFFVATTALAAVLGITVATLVQPGRFLESETIRTALQSAGSVTPPPMDSASWSDLPGRLVGILPQNPLASMVEREMLQVVLFATVVGVALVSIAPAQAKPLLELLGSMQEVCITVVRWCMVLAPLAVFGLMAQLCTKIGLRALMGMSVYVATVVLALLLMLVVYLVLVRVLAGRGPLAFLSATRELLLLAFSTSSSAAVMPLSVKTADEKLGVRPSISQFVVPLGATVNMNGTAVYQAVATLFLAQVFEVDLSIGALSVIVVTAVASSVGAPATPGVGIVILATLLQSVGIPLAGVALVMGVDRILDMTRTAVNVAGDLVACVVLDKWVAGERTADQQLRREQRMEAERARTGEDVVLRPTLAAGA